MGLKIKTVKEQEKMKTYTLTEKLYTNQAKTRIERDGAKCPEGRLLLGLPGHKIKSELAEKLGLLNPVAEVESEKKEIESDESEKKEIKPTPKLEKKKPGRPKKK